jgi:hypothetical protein
VIYGLDGPRATPAAATGRPHLLANGAARIGARAGKVEAEFRLNDPRLREL